MAAGQVIHRLLVELKLLEEAVDMMLEEWVWTVEMAADKCSVSSDMCAADSVQ